MSGKEFEQHCAYRMDWERGQRNCCMSRYGVMGTFIDGKWQPVQSLPDFEGLLPGGRQFIFDAKVITGPSLPLSKYRPGTKESKSRQLEHLMLRSTYGAVTFLLIHWMPRRLKNRTIGGATHAFPVCPQHAFWSRFYANETTSLTRLDCEEYAVSVEWNAPGSCRTERPDVLAAVQSLAHYFDSIAKLT